MNYINTETLEYPITEGFIREQFPNVSFATPFEPLPPYAAVQSTAFPDYDPHQQTVAELPPLLVEGVWVQQWQVSDLAAEARDANFAAVRAYKWEQIKAKRDELSDKGGYKIVVEGVDKWFHSDGKSKTQQLSLFIMGAGVPAVPWKTMDGTFVTMTQSIAAAIFQAAATQDMAIFQAAETHRAALEASQNPAEYDFSTGWPLTYGG